MSYRFLVFLLLIACRLPAQEVAVVSAASFAEGFPVAPDSIASAFGENLAPATAAATETPLPTVLSGVSVTLVDSAGVSHLCPLFFVSPGQINFLVPAEVAVGTAEVRVGPAAPGVRVEGSAGIPTGEVAIAAVGAGLFTTTELDWMSGFILRVDADGTQTFLPTVELNAENEVVPVELEMSPNGDESADFYLIAYGTGNRGSGDLEAVETYIGLNEDVGSPDDLIPTLYNGPQGDFVGLDQTNAGPIPRDMEWFGGGDRAIWLCVDGACSNLAWIQVAPNPNAPVISNAAFNLRQDLDPIRMEYAFDVEDADGDLAPFRVVWAWEDDRRFCLSSAEIPIEGIEGVTDTRVNFTIAKENGLVLGDIERVYFSISDNAGHVSNEIEYVPDPPGSLPGFREDCGQIIDK